MDKAPSYTLETFSHRLARQEKETYDMLYAINKESYQFVQSRRLVSVFTCNAYEVATPSSAFCVCKWLN